MKINLSQKTFDEFTEALNHRMTKVEENTKWMKWIMSYMATILTLIVIDLVIKSIGGN
jgi:hypothetical protein